MSDPSTRRERAGGATCTACPLLCADIRLPEAREACDHGRRAFATRPAPGGGPAAVDSAAALLAGARRVLVTGLGEAHLGAIERACDVAEALGAAIDAGDPAVALASGPTIARSGEVTADFDDLRDRADVVVVWFCAPAATHPRFAERFLPRGATIFHVGASDDGAALPGSRAVPLAAASAVPAARLLAARARGSALPDEPSALRAAVDPLAAAVGAARCLAVVTADGPAGDGVEEWALAEWIRAEAHRRPAFSVPLGGGIGSAGAHAAGVAAVLTWRYGGPGAIARADPHGGWFRPAEADAVRLLDRGEVDAVLVVGRPRPAVAAAVARGAGRLGVVTAAPEPPGCGGIFLPTADPLDEPGDWLRIDGAAAAVSGRRQPGGGEALESVLGRLLAAVRAHQERRR